MLDYFTNCLHPFFMLPHGRNLNLFKSYLKLILSHYYFEISKIVVNFAVLMAILSIAIGNYILESVFALSITKKSDSFILTIGRGTTLILV